MSGAANSDIDSLIKEYIATRDIDLRNRIVEQTLYVAELTARRFAGRGVEYDDLRQTACLALIRAVERADVDKLTSFTAYAARSVAGELKNYFRDRTRLLRLPRSLSELLPRVEALRQRVYKATGRYPNALQLAEELNVTPDAIIEALEYGASGGIASLDAAAQEDGENASIDIPSVDAGFERVELDDAFQRELAKLSALDRDIITARIRGGETQARLAERFGVTQMYVSRLERRVYASLRAQLDSQ